MEITTIGLDIAKRVFQAHGVDANGRAVLRRKLDEAGDAGRMIATVRGDWLLLIEPGARPQYGWVDELAEYITLNAGPARFSPSRTFRRPFLKRLFQPAAPLESGFVLSKREAQSAARAGMSLAELTQGIKTRRLTCEMIPAWAMRGR